MKKRNILLILFIIAGFIANAQVKDISVTVSPAAEYTWWDNQSGISDGALIGGKLGFGFGEFMELRGVYLQSYDLTTNFENFGLANYNGALFNAQDLTIKRYGGEIKANIGTHKLKPYITLGTGIQNIEIPDMDKFEQIYASAGLGIKFNLSPRIVFLLEGKNTTYNFNAGSNLLTSADKVKFGVNDADFSRERLSNWSVQGAMQFYLGGRRPGTMTELDQAYLRQFRGGLRGVQPIIEPGVSYIAFNGKSGFKDTWLVGGYAGIDINDYIGLRGFYFQATENKELSTNFDDLSMYGFEFRARLNDGNGVTPYLTLGGGYLNPTDNYVGKEGLSVKAGEFATGGLGLNIPLGKRVIVSGGMRAMLTSAENTLDVSMPDEIQTHLMYNAGIKFVLGKKSNSPQTIYQENLNRDVDTRMAANNLKVQQMKNEYQEKVAALEEELNKAYETKDVDKAVELLEDKKDAEQSLKEVEKLENAQKIQEAEMGITETKISPAPVPVPEKPIVPDTVSVEKQKQKVPASIIQMTPAEFESLIVKILEAIREKPEAKSSLEMLKPALEQINQNQQQLKTQPQTQPQTQPEIELLNERIKLLEKLLLDVNSRLGVGQQYPNPSSNDQVSNDQIRELSNDILKELDNLERKVDKNAYKIENNADLINDRTNTGQTIVVTPVENADSTRDTYITSVDTNGKITGNQKITDIDVTEPMLKYINSSAMFGLNVGGATTANIGARLNYDINNSPFVFMPEIYIGLGGSTSFGVSGNVVYPISLKTEKFIPYAGLGLGVARIDKKLVGNYNVILGVQLPFISENLSVDYTMRNTFDYNQLAVTYKLPF